MRYKILFAAFSLLPTLLSAQGLFSDVEIPSLQVSASLEQDEIRTHIVVPEGYYINRDLLEVRLPPELADEFSLSTQPYPEPSGEVEGIRYYKGSITLAHKLKGATIPEGQLLSLRLWYQICLEDGSCFLPTEQEYTVDLADFNPGLGSSLVPDPSFWYIIGLLLLSLLAGMILNFTPCIFPVFSLKLQHLLRLSAEDSGRNHAKAISSLLFSLLGIELSFWVLFALLSFSSWGLSFWKGDSGPLPLLWGSYFQQPIILYAFVLLLFVMALNMLRVFQFRTPQLPSLPRKNHSSTWSYDVSHGALIVVLGVPCSAPLLAPLMGVFLLGDDALLGFGGLSLVGLGLWLPYAALVLAALRARESLLLRSFQALQRRMDLVIPLLGFAMLLVVLYFLSVLQVLTGPVLVPLVLASLLLVTLSCWLWHRNRALFILALIASLALSVQVVYHMRRPVPVPTSEESAPITYRGSPEERRAVQDWLAQGHPVFIEYTAEWCLTCKVNQRLLLDTKRFRELLDLHQVFYIRADLTRSNPLLEQEINRLHRVSLPVYVLYLPDSEHLLPTLPRYRDFASLLETL